MTISEMMAALRKPAEPIYIKTKDSAGTKVSYIPWYNAVALADARLGGAWDHELVEHWIDDVQRGSTTKGYASVPLAHVRVRVTIFGDDRQISREAVGVDDEPNGQRGTPLERAEAAGLRRALAKFGLGLHLYGGASVDEKAYTQAPSRTRTEAAGAPPPRAAAKPAAAPATDPHFTARIAAATTSAAVDELLTEIARIDNPYHRKAAEKLAHARQAELAPTHTDPSDLWVADMLLAIDNCQTQADLAALAKDIAKLPPAARDALRGPFGEAQAVLKAVAA